jgi:hypothetical protein
MCCVPESGVLTNPVGPYQDGEDRCTAGGGQPGGPCGRGSAGAGETLAYLCGRGSAGAGETLAYLCGRGSAGAGETLAYLCGRWRVDRDLVDHLSGRTGHLTGEAGFLPVAFCHGAASSPGASLLPGRPGAVMALCYTERGQLRFGEHTGPARRSLLYVAGPELVEVRFRDGRAFHDLDLSAGRWHAGHRCGDDVYLVSYHVLGNDGYREHWAVAGPGKSYEIRTQMRRLAGRAAPPPAPG